MFNNNYPNHSCNADIDEISERKMIIFFKVFHNHRNELKVQKENKNIGKEKLIIIAVANK